MSAKKINIWSIAIMTLFHAGQSFGSGKTSEWLDNFYQYRIPLEVKFEKSGWSQIPLSEKMINSAINKNEELKYRDGYFAYNNLKIVEVDIDNNIINPNPEIGFYLIPTGPELVKPGIWQPAAGKGIAAFEGRTGKVNIQKPDKISVPVEKGQYYLCSFSNSKGGGQPLLAYEPIFPQGIRFNWHVKSSYTPRLLKQAKTDYETLIKTYSSPIELLCRGRFIGNLSKLSFRKVKIRLLADIKKPGTKRYILYYQPMCAQHLVIPQLKRDTIPKETGNVLNFGPAAKFIGDTRYSLAKNDYFDVWYGATTLKLTPETAVPEQSRKAIEIKSAANESESFQLIIRPEANFNLKNVFCSSLKFGKAEIPAANISFMHQEYVPVKQKSHISPVNYSGMIADALLKVKPGLIRVEAGNYGLWVNVKIPTKTVPGIYRGKIKFSWEEGEQLEIPLHLKVYDFELPEYSKFRSNMGGQFFVSSSNIPGNRMIDYHNVKKKEDIKKLVNEYYKVMAENKFYPKNAAMFSELKMKWTPPPKGMNVDAPNNFFKLHDWDFTEYNKQLDHFINKLKVNTICIYHTNPIACNVFPQLPDKEYKDFSGSEFVNGPFRTMGWQIFNETKMVAYNLTKNHSYFKTADKITKKQYERLLTDYLRAIAKNLEKHGWLKYAKIWVDESHNDKQLLHFLKLLKTDPLLKKISVGTCIQGLDYFYKKDPKSGKYMFHDLLDFYTPQIDENYNRFEKYYFKDYANKPKRAKLWPYVVNTSRLEIDVPGVNNRLMGLDVFNRGGCGIAVWDTIWYSSPYGSKSNNPWIDPRTLGNGSLSFFYPPLRKFRDKNIPNFTVVPSLRLATFRESVEDYDYAIILEDLIKKAKKKGINTVKAEKIIKDIARFFYNSVHWSQNDAYLLKLKTRMAEEIEKLNKKIGSSINN